MNEGVPKQDSIKENKLDILSVDMQTAREKLEGLVDKLEKDQGFGEKTDIDTLKETIKTVERDLWKIQQAMVEIAHK